MFSGGSVPKFEKSQGKKRASVNHTAATASTAASAVDLVDEDDDHLDKHATKDGHVREAIYASVVFTAGQPVEIDATAAEAAAASKAATGALSEEVDSFEKSGGGAEPTDEAHFAASPVFKVGVQVRVLPVTAPGSLLRLATGFPQATVVAYDSHKGEYTARPSVMCLGQQTKNPHCAVVTWPYPETATKN